jgi:uncharacterized cupredoxin-like copper-binding protein
MSRSLRTITAAAAAAAVAVAPAAVATAHPASAHAARTTTLHLSAQPMKLRFSTNHLTAKAGTVTLVLVNPKNAGMPHGVAVEGKGVDKDSKIVQPGRTARLTVKLKRGTYQFYCPVPGHKQAGMKGTLTIR